MSKQLCKILLCFLSTSSFWMSPSCQADASGRIISIFFLLALGTLLFLCSWCPPSAAFGDCVIVLVNLMSSKVVSLWILFGTFVFCPSDASYGTANAPRWKMPGLGKLHSPEGWNSSIIRFLFIFITKFINEDWNGPVERCVRTGFVCELGLKEHCQASLGKKIGWLTFIHIYYAKPSNS